MTQTDQMEETEQSETDVVAGHRAVLLLVIMSVSIVTAIGFAIGVFGPSTLSVGRIGPVTFPVTPVTLAIYGLVMTGAALGIFVVLVAKTVSYINSKETT
jgi:uncharacterized membrane protein